MYSKAFFEKVLNHPFYDTKKYRYTCRHTINEKWHSAMNIYRTKISDLGTTKAIHPEYIVQIDMEIMEDPRK